MKLVVVATLIGVGVFVTDRYMKPDRLASAAATTSTTTTLAPTTAPTTVDTYRWEITPSTTTTPVDIPPQAPAPPRQAMPTPTPATRQDSPIYQNVRDWGWLTEAGHAQPGTKFLTEDGACSTGWMVVAEGREFILTAGHCGKRGDAVYVPHPNGSTSYVGQFVESRYTSTGSADYGLVELTDGPWMSTPPFDEPLVGWRGTEWLNQHQPQICHLGWRTGLSCGDFISVTGSILHFRGIVDGGDSGGPVFAVVDGQLVAVGVTSFEQDTDATRVSASLIEEPMQRWGLGLRQ